MTTHPARRLRAYTLIEMLVAIAIIAVLIGMILPAVHKAREAANVTSCRHHLKQIGLALHHYHDGHESFPAGYLCEVNPNDPVATTPGWGWAALLLPHLEQDPLYRRIDFAVSVEADPQHRVVRTAVVKVFTCPSDRQAGVYDVLTQPGEALTTAASNSYAACYGAGGSISEQPDAGTGLFFRNSKVRLRDVADGVGHTFAVGERAATFARTPWAGAIHLGTARVTPGAAVLSTLVEEGGTQVLAHIYPRRDWFLNSPYSDPYDFFSPHAGVTLFTFADGSVRTLKNATPLNVLQALATRAGREAGVGDEH